MEKIYFIGINGIGMSGLAKIMKCKGYEVKELTFVQTM